MMDKQYIRQYEQALLKSLDALTMASAAIALVTGNAMLKSAANPPEKNISNSNPVPSVGGTYKKRSTAFLDTGEERTVEETYKVNQQGHWALVDVKIVDVPSP